MAVCPSPYRRKFSFSAKANGVSAKLHFASGQKKQQQGLFSFFSKKNSSHGGACDVSLRIRVHLFLLKIKIAAGRLRELRIETWRRYRKVSVVDFKDSQKNTRNPTLPPPPSSSPASFASQCSQFFKGSSPSPATGRSSVLSSFLFVKRKRKESSFVCGAGLGAFVLFLLHHASAWSLHFPVFITNAGSCLVGFLIKVFQGRNNSVGSRSAWLWQGIQKAATLLQMVLSTFQGTFIVNRFVVTALLTVLIGLILAGKASKMQDLLAKKERSGALYLPARILLRLLLAVRLLKHFWAHIGMKHALVVVLVFAYLSNTLSRLQKYLWICHL